MKALSIRQPWAWLILHGGKDIENRTWNTKFRGRVLIHASKGMTRDEYDDADFALSSINPTLRLPPFAELQRGGIVGSVEITDCVSQSNSPWFAGNFGFVLKNPIVMPFIPCMGSLSFFTPNVPVPSIS